ncbi:hypothetical protein J4573_53150 [Actinomadura barringtoniae]|uniref:Uncharacterized protein n=1 Tax=Actinomadura barringtoniae TaxID=1427535 RepID=A0A939PMW5_9ACTN|nr:hypothetical protein [Actinomadura barringtoniae]MBO2455907.1 hypothetical protein [Actinomadura barringtoniae]
MSEAADQLVLEYLGRVADVAHGRLSAQERLDFINRLRTRIGEYRGGSDNPRHVRQVLARFGDPSYLVERERRRLDEARAPSLNGEVALGTDGSKGSGALASSASASASASAATDGSDGTGSKGGGASKNGGGPKDADGGSSAPRPPMRVVRRDGRTTRHVVWTPSGVAKLRRELRAQPRNGRFGGMFRQAWQTVTRQWTSTRGRKASGG